MDKYGRRSKSKGFTLIELMLSLVFGILIVGGSVHVFLMVRQTFQTQQGIAYIQENARIFSILLSAGIANHGLIGCNRFSRYMSLKVHPHINVKPYGLDVSNTFHTLGITQEDLRSNALVAKSVRQRALPQSDILWLKRIQGNYRLIEGTDGGRGYLLVKGHPPVHKNQIFAISDCSHIDLVRAVKPAQKISKLGTILQFADENTIELSKYYREGSQVGIFSSVLIYVGDTQRKNSAGFPVFALYSTDLNGRTIELIEGVEYVRVTYAVKNNREISYVPYNQVVNWDQIVCVRVAVLFACVQEAVHKPYTINPSDRRLRMWWQYEWPVHVAV